MAELDKAIAAKRTIAKAKFTRLLKSLKQSLDDNLPEKTIRSRYEAFQSAWDDVQAKHDELMQTLIEPADIEQQDDWIDKVGCEYFSIEGRVDKHLENMEQTKLNAIEAKRQKELEEERARIRKTEEAQRADKTRLEAEARTAKCREFLLHREQEGTKFTNLLKSMRSLLENKDENELRHISEAVKDTQLKLDHAVSCCDEAQKQYILTLEHEKALAETEWISKIWKTYGDTSSQAQIFVSKFGDKPSAPIPKSKEVVKNSGIKLEKVHFRQFSGDIRQYPKFKKDFLKHIQPLCNPNEMAFVLRSHLSNDVNYEIENLGDEMDVIWKRLDKKYGDKGKLVDSIMSDIKGMNGCVDGDEVHILRFINVIEKADMDLKLLGKEEEMRNSTIVGFIEERLSVEMRKEWTVIVTGESRAEITDNKFPHLLKFLLQFKERIEYNCSDIRSARPCEHKVNHTNVKETTKQSTEKDLCWMTHNAPGLHKIWQCRTFNSKTPSERVDLVRANNACLACLHLGHSNLNCPRNFRCNVEGCNLPHHRLLHDALPAGTVLHS